MKNKKLRRMVVRSLGYLLVTVAIIVFGYQGHMTIAFILLGLEFAACALETYTYLTDKPKEVSND